MDILSFIFGIATGYWCKDLIKKYIINKFKNSKSQKNIYHYYKKENDQINL